MPACNNKFNECKTEKKIQNLILRQSAKGWKTQYPMAECYTACQIMFLLFVMSVWHCYLDSYFDSYQFWPLFIWGCWVLAEFWGFFFFQSVVWICHIWLDTDLTCRPAVWKLLCCGFKMSASWFALFFFCLDSMLKPQLLFHTQQFWI